MIMTYEYRAPLGDRDPQTAVKAMRDHATGLIRIRPFLLDVDIEAHGPWITAKLRLTDIERSRIAVNARKSILAMLAKAKLDPKAATLRQALEEPNARSFITGQGRTPRPRRPRSREPQGAGSQAS